MFQMLPNVSAAITTKIYIYRLFDCLCSTVLQFLHKNIANSTSIDILTFNFMTHVSQHHGSTKNVKLKNESFELENFKTIFNLFVFSDSCRYFFKNPTKLIIFRASISFNWTILVGLLTTSSYIIDRFPPFVVDYSFEVIEHFELFNWKKWISNYVFRPFLLSAANILSSKMLKIIPHCVFFFVSTPKL